MRNGILFYGLEKTSPDFLEKLDQRITDRIESAKQQAESPFDYDAKNDAWFIDKSLLGHGQNGGYSSIEQATIALALLKVKDSLNYQQLYQMSAFILAGIKTL